MSCDLLSTTINSLSRLQDVPGTYAFTAGWTEGQASVPDIKPKKH